MAKQGIYNAKHLIKIVADNFVCDISYQNGKSSTHSLAAFGRRLRKKELSTSILNDYELLDHNGPKNPELPRMPMDNLSAEFLELQAMSQRRSDENNYAFLHGVLIPEKKDREFNEYNTSLCKEQGHTIASKTKIGYFPLIDMPSAHPSTMFTYMANAQHTCEKIGQEHVLFTCDQQLYRVALQVKWGNPDIINNVYIHTLRYALSYAASVGILMVETGLLEGWQICCQARRNPNY